ncbi:hypothetical protein B0H10DRAFT_862131 [Mycena sp. CBHHK59/15]|nr:hypothetical protein B0H10DRAFT_862131 [Mycena sp. CBHHK59/15]
MPFRAALPISILAVLGLGAPLTTDHSSEASGLRFFHRKTSMSVVYISELFRTAPEIERTHKGGTFAAFDLNVPLQMCLSHPSSGRCKYVLTTSATLLLTKPGGYCVHFVLSG